MKIAYNVEHLRSGNERATGRGKRGSDCLGRSQLHKRKMVTDVVFSTVALRPSDMTACRNFRLANKLRKFSLCTAPGEFDGCQAKPPAGKV